uniref:Uncharacterized protein n=1 Tax=Anguilla anguilla TaxID=7936 RepID=A0A0E9XPB6_ANGAN
MVLLVLLYYVFCVLPAWSEHLSASCSRLCTVFPVLSLFLEFLSVLFFCHT